MNMGVWSGLGVRGSQVQGSHVACFRADAPDWALTDAVTQRYSSHDIGDGRNMNIGIYKDI
jgi:hypothetical protein